MGEVAGRRDGSTSLDSRGKQGRKGGPVESGGCDWETGVSVLFVSHSVRVTPVDTQYFQLPCQQIVIPPRSEPDPRTGP